MFVYQVLQTMHRQSQCRNIRWLGLAAPIFLQLGLDDSINVPFDLAEVGLAVCSADLIR